MTHELYLQTYYFLNFLTNVLSLQNIKLNQKFDCPIQN